MLALTVDHVAVTRGIYTPTDLSIWTVNKGPTGSVGTPDMEKTPTDDSTLLLNILISQCQLIRFHGL